MMSYHLVHANLSRARADLDDPQMKGFVDHVDEIDELAHQSPGFVAQPILPDEGSVYTGRTLLNVSVWESVEQLRRFTYSGRHSEFLDRRKEWFVQTNRPVYILYWSPAGEVPTEEEIHRRFAYLNVHGPTPHAFTFEQTYTAEEMLAFETSGGQSS
jgi:hypothetical protein